MSDQSFKNHARYIPLWHFFASTAMAALLIGSIINLVNTKGEGRLAAILLLIISIILPILWWYARAFSLRAQDRAIRAEENLRYFILTGKPVDKKLGLGQIIALRFAGDDELPGLAKKTVEENLSQKQIKELIRNWRADHHRA
jgi:hypothetical protein